MDVRPKALERNVNTAKELAKNNNGLLPSPWRMIKMGYGGLHRYILRHPTYFKDLQFQEVVGTEDGVSFNIEIRRRHIETVHKLIKEHGKLPGITWMNNNGYSKLASYMRIHPEVFAKFQNSHKE